MQMAISLFQNSAKKQRMRLRCTLSFQSTHAQGEFPHLVMLPVLIRYTETTAQNAKNMAIAMNIKKGTKIACTSSLVNCAAIFIIVTAICNFLILHMISMIEIAAALQQKYAMMQRVVGSLMGSEIQSCAPTKATAPKPIKAASFKQIMVMTMHPPQARTANITRTEQISAQKSTPRVIGQETWISCRHLSQKLSPRSIAPPINQALGQHIDTTRTVGYTPNESQLEVTPFKMHFTMLEFVAGQAEMHANTLTSLSLQYAQGYASQPGEIPHWNPDESKGAARRQGFPCEKANTATMMVAAKKPKQRIRHMKSRHLRSQVGPLAKAQLNCSPQQ